MKSLIFVCLNSINVLIGTDKSQDSIFLRGYYLINLESEYVRLQLSQPTKRFFSIDHAYQEAFILMDSAIVKQKGIDLSKSLSVVIRNAAIYRELLRDYCQDSLGLVETNGLLNPNHYYVYSRKHFFKWNYFQIFYVEGWFYRVKVTACSKDTLPTGSSKSDSVVYLVSNLTSVNNRPYIPAAFKRLK